MKCLYPQCKHDEHSRGLCKMHLRYANKLVRNKQTSWGKLVANGRATNNVKAGGKVIEWFLSSPATNVFVAPSAAEPQTAESKTA